MTIRRVLALLFIVLLLPKPAEASDPTPLFVLVIGFPAVLFSALALALAGFAPKAGLIVSIILLIIHIPVVGWASDVGYMSSAGWVLYLSMGLNVLSLIVAIVRLSRR